jgi:membrane-bound lytic murein transglycosylase D
MKKAKRYCGTVVILLLLASAAFSGDSLYVSNDQFPLPKELENAVDFWIGVYTKYYTNEYVIHDARNLSITYEVVRLGELHEDQIDLPRTRAQRNLLKNKRKQYRTILLKLASSKTDLAKLSPEEAKVYKLLGESKNRKIYRNAAYNVRSQRGQRDRFKRGLSLSGRYLGNIKRVFREYGLPEELTVIPHVESSFNYRAYSTAGASGIWQITRRTGRRFLRINYEIDERRDPILATEAAAKLLRNKYQKLGTWPLAITAYNHGLAGMRRAKRKLNTTNIAKIVAEYRSRYFGFASRNFYCEFIAALHIVRNYQDYFGEIEFKPPLVFQEFELPYYVKLSSITSHFNLTAVELREYNPALRDPIFKGTKHLPKHYRLRFPVQVDPEAMFASIPTSELFEEQKLSKWYKVRRGDTLSNIARRHRTSIAALMALNNLDSANRIRAGGVLRIPLKAELASLANLPELPVRKVPDKEVETAVAASQRRAASLGADKPERTLPAIDLSSAENRAAVEPEIVLMSNTKPEEGIIEVKPEETLGHYADWLKVPTQRLRLWNDIDFGQDIRLGEKIKLAFENVTSEQFVNSRLEYHRSMEEDFFSNFKVVGTITHQVRRGENIWYLCNQLYKLPLWLIKSYNNDLDFDKLHPGDLILIPEVLALNDKSQENETTSISVKNNHATGSN